MALALFDLDDTIIADDCTVLWNRRMVALGWVDDPRFLDRCDEMTNAYHAGTLSMESYMTLTLKPLIGREAGHVSKEVDAFIQEAIAPVVLLDARHKIAEHSARGDKLVVISASPSYLVEPIARHVGVADALSIQAEVVNGRYTGKTQGIMTFRDGKIHRLQQWLEEVEGTMDGASFYSDSSNDLPLLKLVSYPYVVNPDAALAEHARLANWPILHWS